MLHPPAQRSAFNLSRLLIWVLGGVLTAVSAGQIAAGYRVLIGYAERLLPAVYADSSAHAGNTILSYMSGGESLEVAFAHTFSDLQRVIPGAVLLLADGDGTILEAAGECRLIWQQFKPGDFTGFRGPLFNQESLTLENPCSVSVHFLSGAFLDLDEREAVLLLYAPPHLSDYLRKFDGLGKYLLRALPFGLLLLLGCSWMLYGVYRRIMGQAEALADRTKEFLDGAPHTRLDPGSSREFAEVADIFNRLAEEHQARLSEIESDDHSRQQMMANVVHDMRTPMTAIEGCATLLEQSSGEPARQATYLGMIASAIRSQRELSENLLNVAVLDEAVSAAAPAHIDLWRITEDFCCQLSPLFEQKGLSFSYRQLCTDSTIEGDAKMLGRVVLNLLSNALRYTPSSGSVQVSLAETGDGLTLAVADSGIGITAADVPKIFDDFYCGTSAEAKEIGGSGLGLAVVQRIVKLHRGEIHVSSEPGAGTTFTVFFKRTLDAGVMPEECAHRIEPHASPPAPLRPRPVAEQHLPKLSGLLLIFTIIFPLLCYAEGAQALVFWLGIAAAVILFADGGRLLARDPSKLQFSPTSLTVSLLLLCICASFEGSRVVPGAAAFCGCWVLMLLLQQSIRDPRLALLPLCVILYFVSTQSKPIHLGLALALPLGMLALMLDTNRSFRRIGLELSGIGFLFAVVSSVFQGVILWFFGLHLPDAGYAETSRVIGASLAAALEGPTPHSDRVAELFATSYQYNPFVDYWLFTPEGHSVTGNRQEKVRPLLIPKEDTVEQSANTLIVTQQFASTMYLKRFCAYINCSTQFYVGVHTPGRDTWDQASRQLQTGVLFYVLYVLPATLIALALTGILLNRRVSGQFAIVQTGLERYRNRVFTEPIALASGGSIGRLVKTLNALASRLPRLHAEVADRSQRRREFIRQIGAEIGKTASQVEAAVPQSVAICSAGAIERLNACIAAQRSLLESLFELLRLELGGIALQAEPVALHEIAAESLHVAEQHAQARGIQLEAHGLEHSCFVEADANYLARSLDYVLQQLVRFSDEGSGVVLELFEETPWVRIVCRAHSLPLAEGQFEALDRALSGARTPRPGTEFCGDFWLAIYAHAMKLFTGSLTLKRIPENGLAIELQFVEVARG